VRLRPAPQMPVPQVQLLPRTGPGMKRDTVDILEARVRDSWRKAAEADRRGDVAAGNRHQMDAGIAARAAERTKKGRR